MKIFTTSTLTDYLYLYLILLLSLVACSEKSTIKDEKPNIKYKIHTFQSGKGFGYLIIENEQVLIKQPNIPSIRGNKPFATKNEAILVAELVLSKLQKNQFPPSISFYELDSLGIQLNNQTILSE